ncbi:MAG: M56 family metallopeptidase [Lachnospiraceae bacterium]|nr:M56 family metallopeptidase [Lachnospiraceae bacterium]
MLRVGYKLLSLFSILTAVRLLFPFELPISTNIPFPQEISRWITFLLHPRFAVLGIKVCIWNVIEVLWVISILFLLFRCIKTNVLFHRFIQKNGIEITHEPFYAVSLEKACPREKLREKIRIVRLPMIQSPTVCRFFSYYILLPDSLEFSEDELYFIFRHEISHIVHHDLLIKFFIELICMIYWWNPFCHSLKKQTDLLWELRVDESVTASDPSAKIGYSRCLIRIASHIAEDEPIQHCPGISFSSNSSLLRCRFDLLIPENPVKPKKYMTLLLIPICMVYCLSYLYIFESHYVPPAYTESPTVTIPSADNMYMVLNDDGTYSVYLQGEFIETTDSLEYYPKDCRIYVSQEEALKHEKK